MDHPTSRHRRGMQFASGLAATAVVVVVVAALVGVAPPPHAPAQAAAIVAATSPVTAATPEEGFAVPPALRIDAGEVPPHVQAF